MSGSQLIGCILSCLTFCCSEYIYIYIKKTDRPLKINQLVWYKGESMKELVGLGNACGVSIIIKTFTFQASTAF